MIHKIVQRSVLILLLALPGQMYSAGLSMSVTPTLFEMSAQPFQTWESSVKVINNNATPLTIYADVVNFEPQGESGHGKFLPVFENFTEGATLAEWITVPEESFVIPAESSVAVPLTVRVPEDAAPGGHFAAILIGTKPPNDDQPFQITTSQIVTSLFFVRIEGDVVENGIVRTFTSSDSFVATPDLTFEVRFENKGNVHLQPQGEIVITNMWGKERGVIPINQQTHFGNVLPESIRKFEFAWKGEQSFTDIGRYTASLTLGYGQDSRKFVTKSTHFWIVPVAQVLTVLGTVFGIILFFTFVIRAYVRRMLTMAGVEAYVPPSQRQGRLMRTGDVVISEKVSVRAPLKAGVSDLRTRLSHTKAFTDTFATLARFVVQYKFFFVSVLVCMVIGLLVWHFFSQVMTAQRAYEVTIENPDTDVVISSEEILYQKEASEITSVDTVDAQDFELILINSGDTPGAAAAMKRELESQGYAVAALQSDFEESKERTVIVYDVQVQEAALTLSKKLEGALLSARPGDTVTNPPNMSVYIGNDYSF